MKTIMKTKKINNKNENNKTENNKTIWIWSIIGGIILIILLIIGYWIYTICYKETGEYGDIGKSCFEKIKEIVTGKYRIDIDQN